MSLTPKRTFKKKHVAGKTKRPKCQFKLGGGASCSCGAWGKKNQNIPEPYKDNPEFAKRSRKWKQKHDREIIEKIKRTSGNLWKD